MTGRPDARGDGDGWVECHLGHRHWGLFGAAGLLVRRPGEQRGPDGSDDSVDEVLLQHRATWSHHGGTWGLPGGARHSGESVVQAALREAAEEAGVAPEAVDVHGQYDDDHGGWSYATILATADRTMDAKPTGGESIDVAWVPASAVTDLPLHPGFAPAWPVLRSALRPLTVIVDAANVVGSRPDGWWRDREGAARRLIESCSGLPRDGVAGADLPQDLAPAGLTRWLPRVIVVVEGTARGAASGRRVPGVDVVAARGSGDDEIVAAAQRAADGPVLVVTADRGLRARVQEAGASTVGPRWLTDRVP
jgi:8-oxo-dGTP pyrophosphatase MutT (NUDIX family)